MRAALLCAWLGLGGLAACVPADEAVGLGSVQFTFKVSVQTQEGVTETETLDRWALRFDRVVLGFKTMTLGRIGDTDICSFRGRGARSDVVFDPRFGVVQTFNGIQPAECPDVGIIFGPPGSETTLGEGVTSKDLIELAEGDPAHAIVEATATKQTEFSSRKLRIRLRFDSLRTATRFGGCRAAARGVRILEGRRDEVSVRFAAENLFREALSTSAGFRIEPFAKADLDGNADDVVTMDELDELRLSRLAQWDFYQLPNGTTAGSFGDFVRVLFRFSFSYRSEGLCLGNEPGTEIGGQPPPDP